MVEELRAVAPQWRSAKWFAETFEVSSRTIERDLSALQQAGVPIYATPGRRGGYAIDVRHTLPPLNLSAAEVAAVATALAADTATPFTHAGRTALQKILAVLGELDAEGVRELASRSVCSTALTARAAPRRSLNEPSWRNRFLTSPTVTRPARLQLGPWSLLRCWVSARIGICGRGVG